VVDVDIRPLADSADDAEARACATIMATTDPWLTLGRTFDRCLATVRDTQLERYVAVWDGEVVGFVLLSMRGSFTGYIKSVAVREDWRRKGVGRKLLAFAEERIFRDSPNVFICVSSFNPRARALYQRLGYETVGELRDFIVRGHDEILLRKTIGPLTGFSRP
jgi:[ribosomal protein S18]-alanine N-acetyltransferase